MKMRCKLIAFGILLQIVMMTSASTTNQAYNIDNNYYTDITNPHDCENDDLYDLEPQADNYNVTQWKSFFDNEITNVMSVLNIPGMSLSVVNSTDILYKKGYGYASLEESKLVDPDTTIFRLGSVSKLFTWTAVMQVYEQGLIDFDEDINTYLTAFKIKEKFNQPITMKHLITHSAGFEADWIWNGDATEETLLSLEDYMIKFQPRRVSPPGETTSYSNYGAGLAAYIVTQVSGLDYETFIEENIFDPLKMNYSTFRQPFPEHLKNNFASEYAFDDNGEPVLGLTEFVLDPPAGGLATTASDVAKFMMAHLNNGTVDSEQIMQDETTHQMHQRLFSNDPRLSGWTYGFVDTNFRGVRILHHGGAVARSGGIIFLLPDLDIGVYLSYNSETILSTVVILANFLESFFTLEPFSILYPTSTEGLDKFAGKYIQAGVWETTPYKLERVIDHLEVRITNDGYLLFKGQKFVRVDDLLFRADNSFWYIAFRENKNGKITYLMQGGFTQVPYEKLRGVANPTVAWIHHISCMTFLGLIGLEYPIRKIIEKLRKKEYKLDIKETFASRSSYRLSIFTSLAYFTIMIAFFIILFADFESRKLSISLLNVVAFLPYLIIPFSGLLLVSAIYSWIKNEGSLRNRILTSSNLIITGFHLWFIFFWNIVGFLFNYGVWIPYLG